MPLGSMCVTTGNDEGRVFLTETELLQHNPAAANIRAYQYRPFDLRRINYVSAQLARSRRDVMEQFYQPNVGLLVLGQTRHTGAYDYAFLTANVTDKNCLSTEANCSVFPLYRYLSPHTQAALPGGIQPTRVGNVRDELLAILTHAYGHPVTPEQVFYYTYAVLNAHGYLTEYEQQLRVEFPHIPFPRGAERFAHMANLGSQLAEAHLGNHVPALQLPFNTTGNSVIEFAAVLHVPEQQAIQINPSGTTLGGVSTEMWEYTVGTRRPLRDWLEARNGRIFVLDYTEPQQQVLVNEFRAIARRIAAALPLHQQLDESWTDLLDAH
ncbi:MAG: hypothetical protein DMG96_38710 [Acidobacteria bacterium]|nr:MAG: hypothetical protein DMG96_38710 [Acidobacteriota bacterium]